MKEPTNFQNIYTIPEKGVFCYRTANTVYEETFENGRLSASGWNAAGYTLNVLDSCPTRISPDTVIDPEAFRLEADGYSLDTGWVQKDFSQKHEENENGLPVTRGTLVLESEVRPVRLTVHTELDGTAVIVRWLTIENIGDTDMAIGHISPLSGPVECISGWRDYVPGKESDALYTLGFMPCDKWGSEGAFKWNRLPEAVFSVCGRWKYARHRHPMFILKNNALGTVITAQLGWSGGYSFDFRLQASDNDAKFCLDMRLDGPAPYIVLAPGEAIDTPKVHIAALFGGTDDAVNVMHDHIRRSVFTLPEPRGVRGGWVEAGMGAERIMDIEATKHFADTAAAVGAETLIIDAGWTCKIGEEGSTWWRLAGDWVPDEGHYPNGISEVRDYIHGKGLLFGLWVDIERIGYASKLFEAHPDWAVKDAAGKPTSLLDFTNPEAALWAENELARIFTDYKVDLFRLDYNISGSEPMYYVRHRGERESAAARYHKAVYGMYRRLRKRFPDIVFENCAGGGGRTDLGLMENFTHTWVSDWQIAPRSAVITNGMTMALPPERVDRLVSGMNSHTRASLDFMVRQTLFGRPTTNSYCAVGAEQNPEQIAFVRHSFSVYKDFIRPFAADGLSYHHTPELYGIQPQGTLIMERGSKERDRSVIGIFRLSGAVNEEDTVVYPRGIDIGGTYEVTFDNSGETAVRDGFSLVNNGIRVRLPGTLTSELILIRRKS